MQIEVELQKIKELTGMDSIADSLDALHQEAIDKINACREEYNTLELYKKYFLLMHPVGHLYYSTSEINPGDIYGGKWEPYAQGRIPVCINTMDEDFREVNLTGGDKEVTHNHTVNNHMHNLSHTHEEFDTHTHSYEHIHELRGAHAHTMEHRHKIPIHSHTAPPHQHLETQTSMNGSVKIGKPMYGQLYHTSYESAYWVLSKKEDMTMEADTTSINTVERTEENKQQDSSYANENTTSNAIHTLYQIDEIIYDETKKCDERPKDKNGTVIDALETAEIWSGPCMMDGQSLQDVTMSTLQPFITCYIFKRIE